MSCSWSQLIWKWLVVDMHIDLYFSWCPRTIDPCGRPLPRTLRIVGALLHRVPNLPSPVFFFGFISYISIGGGSLNWSLNFWDFVYGWLVLLSLPLVFLSLQFIPNFLLSFEFMYVMFMLHNPLYVIFMFPINVKLPSPVYFLRLCYLLKRKFLTLCWHP